MADDWQVDINGWDLETSLAIELEAAMELLTLNLWAYVDDPESPELDGWEPPSGYPYCGCTTCDTREALSALVPLIAQATTEGRIVPTGEGVAPGRHLRLLPALAHEEDTHDDPDSGADDGADDAGPCTHVWVRRKDGAGERCRECGEVR